MNVTGQKCGVCGKSISFQKDGTWCRECSTPFHGSCIALGDQCSGCSRRWTDPADGFVFSALCPSCLRKVDRAENCPACGTRTRWDTEEDFAAFRDARQTQLIRMRNVGLAMVPVGAIILLATVGMTYLFFTDRLPILFAPGLTGLVGLGLCGGGLTKIFTSSRLKAFR